jgi:cytochrome c1
MTMKRTLTIALGASTLLAAAALSRCFADDAKSAPVTPTTGVHTIELPKIDHQMPPGPGSQTLATGCIICHSNRYITMQPPLSRTAWTALVTKMRKTFGAPISDQQAAEVVNYLVSIRGNGQP